MIQLRVFWTYDHWKLVLWSYMISVCCVLLNNLAIDIACLSLYCVNVTTLSVKVISLPFYDNVYRVFKDPYDILDIQRVSYMLFIQLPYMVIYHMLIFCTLVSITIINFFLDDVSNVVPVQILTNNLFHYIYSWKK